MTDFLIDIQLRLAGALDRFADHGDGGRAAEDLRATATCILSLISERRANGITSVDVDEKTWEKLLDLSATYGGPVRELVNRALRIFLKDEPGVYIYWAPEVQAAREGGYLSEFQQAVKDEGYAKACSLFPAGVDREPVPHAEPVKVAGVACPVALITPSHQSGDGSGTTQ